SGAALGAARRRSEGAAAHRRSGGARQMTQLALFDGPLSLQPGAHLLCEGDAADVCAALPEDLRFDLVYADPPCAVGGTMSMREKIGQARGRKQKQSGRDAYADPADVDALVAHLEMRLSLIRQRMRAAASLFVHLDWRAVHDVKVALDRVFGRRAFAGEIVWTPNN